MDTSVRPTDMDWDGYPIFPITGTSRRPPGSATTER